MEIKHEKIKLVLSGTTAGIINGFFGGGGGMALVPMLTGLCGLEEKKAFATSVAVTFPLCAVSAIVYFFRTGFDFKTALPYLLGGLIGGTVSGLFFKKIPAALLRRIFAILVIYGGLRALLWA